MPQSYDELRPEYHELWSRMEINASAAASVDADARRIVSNRAIYMQVTAIGGVPYPVVGVLHTREASGNFHCHLHNGDPLSARTVHVPKGRPLAGNPPFTWMESAADALALDHLTEQKDWSIEHAAFMIELYNGFGYRAHGIHSPYLWSGSNEYSVGKYVADGKFSSTEVDRQIGCMPILKRIMELDSSVTFGSAPVVVPSVRLLALPAGPPPSRQPAPHPDLTPHPGSWGVLWSALTHLTEIPPHLEKI
jgi:lysozyme family protein